MNQVKKMLLNSEIKNVRHFTLVCKMYLDARNEKTLKTQQSLAIASEILLLALSKVGIQKNYYLGKKDFHTCTIKNIKNYFV